MYSRCPPAPRPGYRGAAGRVMLTRGSVGTGRGRPGPGDLWAGWPVALHSKVTPPRPALLCSGGWITNASASQSWETGSESTSSSAAEASAWAFPTTLPTDAKMSRSNPTRLQACPLSFSKARADQKDGARRQVKPASAGLTSQNRFLFQTWTEFWRNLTFDGSRSILSVLIVSEPC